MLAICSENLTGKETDVASSTSRSTKCLQSFVRDKHKNKLRDVRCYIL
jgi:RNase P/RNase MRP subunit p29